MYFEVSKLIEGEELDAPLRDNSPTSDPFETHLDSRIGRVLKGRYRVRSRLGSGGVGVVYLAEDLHLMSRLVVVKFLHEHGRSEPGRLVKFLQEAEALARMDHPGIVAAFDADGAPDGAHFFVMQYVDGRTLRGVVDEGPVELPRTGSILRQLGSALNRSGAPERRNPSRSEAANIMLQKLGDGREIMKLIDFGVARVEASAVSSDTAVIRMAGTPSYMAPEHLSGKPVTAQRYFFRRGDCVEILTGQAAFHRQAALRIATAAQARDWRRRNSKPAGGSAHGSRNRHKGGPAVQRSGPPNQRSTILRFDRSGCRWRSLWPTQDPGSQSESVV